MDKIVSLAKRRGFVYPASEIYGGLSNSWDYGPLGAILKENIKNEWLKEFVLSKENMLLLDSAIIQNPKVWEASGHLEKFSDPLSECSSCHKRYRSDNLIDEALEIDVDGFSLEDIDSLIDKNNIVCPNCKKRFLPTQNFNLMFQTFLGPVKDSSEIVYLRPETCQGIFTNFDNIQKSSRVKLPFGVAQVGKSFRNEITPGNFIFRTLELEQLEIEYFTYPDRAEDDFNIWLENFENWYERIGIKKENLKRVELNKDQRAHYSLRTVDLYFNFPFGFKELQSFANRSDYDLKAHSKLSGKKLSFYDETQKKEIIPFVVEPSVGLGRLFLALLSNGYREEKTPTGIRTVLSLSFRIAPFQIAVFPLMNKNGIDVLSKKIYTDLKNYFRVVYDESGSIGKRYRRQDEIGTPLCITVDQESIDNNTVTIRDRDSMKQVTLRIEGIKEYIDKCFI